MTVASGASGSGGGVVVLKVAPEYRRGPFGTATIAGQPFSVTQGAGACGALDVTSQVSVTRTQLVPIPFSTMFSQNITVRNVWVCPSVGRCSWFFSASPPTTGTLTTVPFWRATLDDVLFVERRLSVAGRRRVGARPGRRIFPRLDYSDVWQGRVYGKGAQWNAIALRGEVRSCLIC